MDAVTRCDLRLRLRALWLEAGAPQDLTDFVNRLDVYEIVKLLEQGGAK